MTEQEWLTSNDPQTMLEWANCDYSGPSFRMPPISPRKLRLFACACCRQVWDGVKCSVCEGRGAYRSHGIHSFLTKCGGCNGTGKVGGLTDPRSRHAVEVAERFADGLATEEELDACYRELETGRRDYPDWLNAAAMFTCLRNQPTPQQYLHTDKVLLNNGYQSPATQAALLLDIIGNPWQPVSLYDAMALDTRTSDDHRWFYGEWLTPTVRHVAQVIYDDRAWDRMPELADALEEAGCTDIGILAHCRGLERCWDGRTWAGTWVPKPVPCVRGCWVVDLILGRG